MSQQNSNKSDGGLWTLLFVAPFAILAIYNRGIDEGWWESDTTESPWCATRMSEEDCQIARDVARIVDSKDRTVKAYRVEGGLQADVNCGSFRACFTIDVTVPTQSGTITVATVLYHNAPTTDAIRATKVNWREGGPWQTDLGSTLRTEVERRHRDAATAEAALHSAATAAVDNSRK